MKLHLISSISWLIVLSSQAQANITCPPIFGSHMVLQRDQAVPVWGTAAPGEKVTVNFAGSNTQTTAGRDGAWQVKLPPLAASAQAQTLVISGTNELRFDDVLVGEVWLCSGQSNMEKPLGARKGQRPTDNAEEEIRKAKHPLIRVFQMPRNGRKQPDDLTMEWHPCAPETVNQLAFSAAAYFFGRKIQAKLGVPVGLIHTSVGGTRIELWTPPRAYQGITGLEKLATAAAGDRKVDDVRIGGLYDPMVKPLAPFGIRGFLWYQGESNLMADDGLIYTEKMRALINGWRAAWQLPEAPFYFVQLAPHLYSSRKIPNPFSDQALPLFWEAQTKALSIPHTGMAVITDTAAQLSDIHPTNKQDVGERLARIALARTYGKKQVVDSGPIMKEFMVKGRNVGLKFDHADGLESRDGEPLSEFTLAGEDRVFHRAAAVIRNGNVVVSSNKVQEPVAVRLGWNERANPNLVNGAELPARSFRTDDWPVETHRPTEAAP
ncbi:MAG: sialate O-acetylesterase [Akkermansiaceae bacterium]